MSDISTRLYRFLLSAYPPSFRREYGDLMTQAFRDCLRTARQSGGMAVAIFWLRAGFDLTVNALEEHMKNLHLAQKPGFYLRFVAAVIAMAITLPLLFMTLYITLNIVADPTGYGAPTGAFQQAVVRLLGRSPGSIIVPLAVLALGSLIIARASLSGRCSWWLPWRFALVNLLACPVLVLLTISTVRLSGLLFPPDPNSETFNGMTSYEPAVQIISLMVYGVLVAALLYAQRWAVSLRQQPVQAS